MWDSSKSPEANLRDMGLSVRPSKERSGRQKEEKPAESKNIIELYDIPESDEPKQRRYPLDEEDEKYIAKCMAKYGDSYTTMSRDINLNNLQHTEAKLQKLGARYLLLTPEQRRIEVPDSVRPLLAATD